MNTFADKVSAAVATVALASALSLTTTPLPTLAVDTSSSPSDLHEKLQSMSLRVSEDRPQIKVPADANLEKSLPPSNTLQALISLQNPQRNRPLGNDVLVVTVWDSKDQSLLLGGAKIPVAKVRSFPVMIQMGPKNSKLPVEKWNALVPATEDLWIQATICPEDASEFPCPPSEQRLSATGKATLLKRLPGLEAEIATGIRVPATLPLAKVGSQ